jgi:hypothetical protein
MRGSRATPSIAEMRPDVTAGPMWRASIAPKLFESSLTLPFCAGPFCAGAVVVKKAAISIYMKAIRNE